MYKIIAATVVIWAENDETWKVSTLAPEDAGRAHTHTHTHTHTEASRQKSTVVVTDGFETYLNKTISG